MRRDRSRPERAWPLRVSLRRCSAYFYRDDGPQSCGGLLWPWQDLRRDWDPECGGRLQHHACHHRSTRELWSSVRDEDWTTNLNCEHRTERATSGVAA